LVAGIQAALLSVVCVMVPAVAAFTATSAATVNNGVSWLDAARGAADLWLLGHGGSLTVGSGTGAAVVTLTPLGLGLFSILGCRLLARVSAARGWQLIAWGTAGYVGVAAVVMFVVATPSARPSAAAGLVGATTVGLIGFAWGNTGVREPSSRAAAATGRRWPLAAKRALDALPPWLGVVPRVASLLALGSLAAAGLLTCCWAVSDYERCAEITASFDAGLIGAVTLSLLSLVFWPNLAVLTVAYMAGPGFSIGQGNLFSPTLSTPGALPEFPLLGILPATSAPASVWLPAVLVALGAGAGLWLQRRLPAFIPWWTMAGCALLTCLVAAGGLTGLVVAASGAAGPGRMAQVGAPAGAVFVALMLELAGGCVPVAVLARAPVAYRLYDAFHPERPIRVVGRSQAAGVSPGLGSAD
jgi:hypothetical protein